MKHAGNKTQTVWAKRIYEDFETETFQASDVKIKDGFMVFVDEYGKPVKIYRSSDIVMVN